MLYSITLLTISLHINKHSLTQYDNVQQETFFLRLSKLSNKGLKSVSKKTIRTHEKLLGAKMTKCKLKE